VTITDRQLAWIFSTRLSSSNARYCGRYFGAGNGCCEASTEIVDGTVVINGACGKACDFLKRAVKLRWDVEQVIIYEKIIEESKRSA
jgi:hypothetical protein